MKWLSNPSEGTLLYFGTFQTSFGPYQVDDLPASAPFRRPFGTTVPKWRLALSILCIYIYVSILPTSFLFPIFYTLSNFAISFPFSTISIFFPSFQPTLNLNYLNSFGHRCTAVVGVLYEIYKPQMA